MSKCGSVFLEVWINERKLVRWGKVAGVSPVVGADQVMPRGRE